MNINLFNENNLPRFDLSAYRPDGTIADTPKLPNLPTVFRFEVEDGKAGRSMVATALNHGNPNFNFGTVRELAEALGCVEKARDFQGIVLSDVSCAGSERYLLSASAGYPTEIFSIEDEQFDGSWHIFPLTNRKVLLGDYQKGDGFLLLSSNESYVAAVFTGDSWLIEGGGGTVYSRFLRVALSEGLKNGVVRSLTSVPKNELDGITA